MAMDATVKGSGTVEVRSPRGWLIRTLYYDGNQTEYWNAASKTYSRNGAIAVAEKQCREWNASHQFVGIGDGLCRVVTP